MYWSGVMETNEYSDRGEERDLAEKWKMESKESSPATPANTPVEESEDKSLSEQVNVTKIHKSVGKSKYK